MDYRSYVHKQFFVSKDKDLAIEAKEMYMELGESNSDSMETKCIIKGMGWIRAKKKGEIIRYYPELGIAKVLFRFTNEELNAPARIDVRKRTCYVPMLLLHDTLPKIDTVKYIPFN